MRINCGTAITLANAQEGDVVVCTDGKHCDIFVDSEHFAHASSSHKKAVELSSSELPYVFSSGYQIRQKN